MERKHLVYDLETYPNIFTCCAVFANGKGMRVFEVSDRTNDSEAFVEFLRNIVRNGYSMVGFNNIGFDYQLIHHVIQKSRKAKASKKPFEISAIEMYNLAQEVIESNKDGFGKSVKASEIEIPQIDLYKTNHYDNKARRTGLKILEFNMRMANIEDLPYAVGQYLTGDQMDVLIEYNKHDVLATLDFYRLCDDALTLRENLTEKFGFDCTNMNDSKIGSEYFISRLEKSMPGCCYTKTPFGRKLKQTKRSEIVVKDILFDYLEFDRKEFVAIHEWFKRQIICETKGVFSDLLEKDVGDVAKHARMTTKRKKMNDPFDNTNKRYVPSFADVQARKLLNPHGWVEEKELKSPKGAKSYYWCWNEIESMNVVVDGLEYVFGTGGLHASAENTIFRSDDNYIVIDADV